MSVVILIPALALVYVGGNYVRFRVDESYATLEAAPCLDAGCLGAGWYEEQTAWEADPGFR